MRFFFLAACTISAALAQWSIQSLPAPTQTEGAALHANHLYSWGRGVHRGRTQLLAGDYGPAGCLTDVNRDGHIDLILHRLPSEIVWLEGPRLNRARIIDTEADFANCLGTTLLGRRGILLTHRGLQVRFYEIPANPQATQHWPYREIYSFYTASYQAGLLERDIDGDGRPDLLCGNYWIQSPPEYALPWRLYAINTYNETPESAHMQLDWANGALLTSQPAMEDGKVALFTPPADPKQLWRELPIAAGLRYPRAVAWRDGQYIVSDASRLWLYSGPSRQLLRDRFPIHTLVKTPGAILAAGPAGALLLKPLP